MKKIIVIILILSLTLGASFALFNKTGEFIGKIQNDTKDEPFNEITWDYILSQGVCIKEIDYSSIEFSNDLFKQKSSDNYKYITSDGNYNIICRDVDIDINTTEDGVVLSTNSCAGNYENYIHSGYKMNVPLSDFTYMVVEFTVNSEVLDSISNPYIMPDFRDPDGNNMSNTKISFFADCIYGKENFLFNDGDGYKVTMIIASSGKMILLANDQYLSTYYQVHTASSDNPIFNGFKVVSMCSPETSYEKIIILDDVHFYQFTEENDFFLINYLSNEFYGG